VVSQGHVHVLRVTCERDEPSSSQHPKINERLVKQSEVCIDSSAGASIGANTSQDRKQMGNNIDLWHNQQGPFKRI
jgi:hypothetical protein